MFHDVFNASVEPQFNQIVIRSWLDRVVRPIRMNKEFMVDTIPYTPPELIEEIFSKIKPIADRCLETKIGVIYTIEMAIYLTALGFKDVTLITHIRDARMAAGAVKFGFKYETVRLEERCNMKFDVVVGNPPYQEGNTGCNKTIYHKFFYLATYISKHTTIIVLIAPTTWLKSTKPILQKLHKHLCDNGLYEITNLDSNKMFGVTVDSLGIVWLNKQEVSSLTTNSNKERLLVKILSKTDVGMLSPKRGRTTQITKKGDSSQNGRGDVQYNQTETFKYKTINRVSNSHGDYELSFCNIQVDDDSNHIRVVYGIISTGKSLGPIHICSDGENLTQMCCYLSFDTIKQAENCVRYLQSKIFKFMLIKLRPKTTNSLGIIRKIPKVPECLSEQELYNYFNLTQEEIKLIEETIK